MNELKKILKQLIYEQINNNGYISNQDLIKLYEYSYKYQILINMKNSIIYHKRLEYILEGIKYDFNIIYNKIKDIIIDGMEERMKVHYIFVPSKIKYKKRDFMQFISNFDYENIEKDDVIDVLSNYTKSYKDAILLYNKNINKLNTQNYKKISNALFDIISKLPDDNIEAILYKKYTQHIDTLYKANYIEDKIEAINLALHEVHQGGSLIGDYIRVEKPTKKIMKTLNMLSNNNIYIDKWDDEIKKLNLK